MTRLTFGQAGALALLLALHLNGAALGGTVPTVFACAAILLIGLPHGALDLEIIRRERGTGRVGIAALLMLYIGLAAAMAAVWRSAPVAALAVFLVVAFVHFAEDWPEMGSTFLAQGMAIALLAAPALLHLGQLEQLFVALSGHRDGAAVANIMLLVAPVGIVVASVALVTLWRTGARDQAVAGALTLAAMLLLPPVVGFALFFCLYHSPRHLGAAMSRVARSPGARWIALLATLAALGITAALFIEEVRADVPERIVAASFLTLSLLTVPHMIVPAVVARLDALRAGGQAVSVRFPPSPLSDRREKMQIKDRPEYARKGAVLTMTADASVATAVTVMSEKNYGAVVIVSADEKPIGIVTERDFMRRLLAKGLDPKRTALGEIMTDDLKVAKPEDELLDWLRQMSNDRFRHVPVVGEDGRVITIMSQGDFVSYTWPQLFARFTEQAKATFELSPSMFAAFGGATLFFLAVIAVILATS